MKYPRVKREDDKRYKVTEEEVRKMKELKTLGFSSKKISLLLNIPLSTVKYHILDSYRERTNQKRAEKDVERWKNDPEFRRVLNERKKMSLEERRSRDKEFVVWNKIASAERYYENQKKRAEIMLEMLDTVVDDEDTPAFGKRIT